MALLQRLGVNYVLESEGLVFSPMRQVLPDKAMGCRTKRWVAASRSNSAAQSIAANRGVDFTDFALALYDLNRKSSMFQRVVVSWQSTWVW